MIAIVYLKDITQQDLHINHSFFRENAVLPQGKVQLHIKVSNLLTLEHHTVPYLPKLIDSATLPKALILPVELCQVG